MIDHPSVTLLFTDIEGSTRRWEQQRAAMAVALAQHDAILRACIEDAGGMVFKTVGDAFCAVFTSPQDAVRAALAAQRRLLAEDWSASGPDFAALRVRMGIHTGSPDARAGDYFGPDVNRVARLMSAGHGGQVLVSGAAAALVADLLPQDVSLRDLGERKLKDLRQPDHVFQLAAPGLGADFPPLATLDARPNNLPLQLTALVGREAELQELAQMLRADAGPRQITLTGPGGTGKTRLALQAAADQIDDFDHGVWWVDLSPLVDPELVSSTIAKVLGVIEVPGVPIEDTLTDWLSKRALLLVLDNYEQLLPAAPLAARLLSAAPKVKVLATSREPLQLRGERVFPVSPLAVPNLADGAELQHVIQFAAVELFIQRAVDVQPSFAITGKTAPAVAQICVRLDGLPLAIELAAARIDRFPPAEMLAQIEARLGLLVDGYRDLPSRQQTMRRAIAWSYDLLSEAEQRLFRRLGVFAGGWNVMAAEVVTGGHQSQAAIADPDRPSDLSAAWTPPGGAPPVHSEDLPSLAMDVLEGLMSLAAKSLIRPLADDGDTRRFGMLETIREFGGERLRESGEGLVMATRHALFYWRKSQQDYDEETYFLDPGAGWRMFQAEIDNYRAALDWSVANDTALGLTNLVRIGAMSLTEKMNWLERLSTHFDQVPVGARAAAALVSGSHAFEHGNFLLAESRFRQAAALHAEDGDRPAQADALLSLAWTHYQLGKFDESDSLFDAAAEVATASNRRGVLVGAVDARWQVALERGRHDSVLPLLRADRDLRERLGLPAVTERDDAILMYVTYLARDFDAADEHLANYLTLVAPHGVPADIFLLDSIGRVHLGRDRSEPAAGAFLAGLRITRDIEWTGRDAIPWHIDGLAGAARRQQAPTPATMLRGAAAAWRKAGGKAIPPAEQWEHDTEIAALRAVLGDDDFDAAWQRGQALTPQDALDLAEATVTAARYDDPAVIPLRGAATD